MKFLVKEKDRVKNISYHKPGGVFFEAYVVNFKNGLDILCQRRFYTQQDADDFVNSLIQKNTEDIHVEKQVLSFAALILQPHQVEAEKSRIESKGKPIGFFAFIRKKMEMANLKKRERLA